MLTDLQVRLLDMMTWLDNFIRKNNLRYFVIGGTLLGAVRHKGFIPWDDDIDIALPRKDYEMLIDLLKKPIDNYIIESPKNVDNEDYVYPYAKLYDIRTTLVEKARNKIVRGIFIDIFPLDGLGQTKEEGLKYYKNIDRNAMFLATRTCAIRKNRKLYKNMAIILARLIPSFILDERKLCSKIDKMCALKDYDSQNYVGNLLGVYRDKETYYKDILGTPKEYDFENIKVLGPEHADVLLTQMYGDWTKLPEEEKRGVQHDFIEIDFNKSYISRKMEMECEK